MTLMARLRAMGRNPGLVIGATIGTLLIVVPAIVLASLVATGQTDDHGALVFLAMLLAAGIYVWISILRQAGSRPAPRQVVTTDATGLYGPTVTLPEPSRPSVSPWRVVGAILGLLVVGSLAIAFVLSVLDNYLFGRPHAAQVVVSALALVVLIIVGSVIRRVINPRTPQHSPADR